jgi:hypothetical protein
MASFNFIKDKNRPYDEMRPYLFNPENQWKITFITKQEKKQWEKKEKSEHSINKEECPPDPLKWK